MATGTKKILVSAALLLVPYFAPAAFAHHLMGGEVPATAWQGLLSGLVWRVNLGETAALSKWGAAAD